MTFEICQKSKKQIQTIIYRKNHKYRYWVFCSYVGKLMAAAIIIFYLALQTMPGEKSSLPHNGLWIFGICITISICPKLFDFVYTLKQNYHKSENELLSIEKDVLIYSKLRWNEASDSFGKEVIKIPLSRVKSISYSAETEAICFCGDFKKSIYKNRNNKSPSSSISVQKTIIHDYFEPSLRTFLGNYWSSKNKYEKILKEEQKMKQKMIEKYLEYAKTDESFAVLFVKKNLKQARHHWVYIKSYKASKKFKASRLEFETVECELFRRKIQPKYPPKKEWFDEDQYTELCRAITWETADKDIRQQKEKGIVGPQYVIQGIKKPVAQSKSKIGTSKTTNRSVFKIQSIRRIKNK